MRKVAAITAMLVLATPALGQDLTALNGCYLESSVAGTFLAAGDRQSQGSIGAGCDVAAGMVTIGGGIRADWGDWTSGSLFGKAGLFVNPNLALYGLGEWRVRDWRIKDAGQLQLGAGVETTAFFNGISAFAEATTSVAKFGPSAARDDVLIRLGARYRF